MSETCPKCGAERTGPAMVPDWKEHPGWGIFACGSTIGSGGFNQSTRCLEAELAAMTAENDHMHEVFTGLRKAHQWLSQLEEEPDRDTDAIEKAICEYEDTLDTAIKMADPKWTATYIERVVASNHERGTLKADNARLREALEKVRGIVHKVWNEDYSQHDREDLLEKSLKLAKAALAEKETL